MKRILLVTILLPFLLLGCSQEKDNSEANPETNPESDGSAVEKEKNSEQENEEPPAVNELMAHYRDFASSNGKFEADDQNKVLEFQSKEELAVEASQFLSQKLVQEVLNLRYEDREDGVYVIPMDGPVTLDETKDYHLEKISDTEYRLTQEISNDLHGHIHLEVIFRKENDYWIIQDVIEHQAS